MRGDNDFPETTAGSDKNKRKSLLKLFRGDFPVFVLFFVISFFFWWSRTMSENYEVSIPFPVELRNIPDEVRVISDSRGEVTISFGGKGSALWRVKNGSRRRLIGLDCSQFHMGQGKASYPTLNLRDSLSGILPSSVVIRQIEPDSIYFRYLSQKSVMLPVAYGGSFESQDQYSLERVIFEPDSILCFIPVEMSDEYDAVYVSADNITLNKDTVSLVTSLKPLDGVILENKEVNMTVVSQQFTEKIIDVPVTGVNFPEGITIRAFPSRVSLVFWVKMADFELVTSNDFKVVIDYNDIEGRNVDMAELHLFSQPANVTNVRLQTNEVEFLMEEGTLDNIY